MKTRTSVLAAAAATLFLSGGVASVAAHEGGEKAEKIKCEGVNGCKGTSACKTLFSNCAGHNECKGKGFLMLTPEECEKARRDAGLEPAGGEDEEG